MTRASGDGAVLPEPVTRGRNPRERAGGRGKSQRERGMGWLREGSKGHGDTPIPPSYAHSGKQGLRAARQGQGAGPASSQPWQPLRGVRSRREGGGGRRGAPRHGDLSGGRRHPSGSHFPMWSFPLLTRTWRLETDFSLGDKKHKKHLNERIQHCFLFCFGFFLC